jgi:hypothetical protein
MVGSFVGDLGVNAVCLMGHGAEVMSVTMRDPTLLWPLTVPLTLSVSGSSSLRNCGRSNSCVLTAYVAFQQVGGLLSRTARPFHPSDMNSPERDALRRWVRDFFWVGSEHSRQYGLPVDSFGIVPALHTNLRVAIHSCQRAQTFLR